MSEYSPLISIVIPVYNGSNFLAEAIDSALTQTYPNVEVIVVNDGSNDNGATATVAKSYGNKIRYFEKENGGSSSAINYGIMQMRGEWFSWLSHDDIYLHDKLQAEMDYLCDLHLPQEDMQMHMLFSGSELINASGKVIRRTSAYKEAKIQQTVETIKGNEYLIAQPRKFNFHGCSCLIHKRAFETVGVLDEQLRILNDVEWWFRIYSSGIKMHYVPKVLVKGRIHAAQVGRSIGYSAKHPENDMLWKKRLEWLKNNYPEVWELFVLLGENAYLSGRKVDGDAAFDYAARICKKNKPLLMYRRICCIVQASVRSIIKKCILYLLK